MKLSRYILFMILFPLFFNGQVSAGHTSSQTADSIHVISYNIHLSITDFVNNSIGGYTTLIITPRVNGIDAILLDLLALHIDSVQFNNTANIFSYNDTLLKVPLGIPIDLGDTVEVKVFYHGQPVADAYWGGFGFSNGTAYNLGVAFISVPHCFGRVWFPCIDDFKDRSFYDCHITTPADKKAVCGGLLISQQDNGDGTITWHWKLSSPIPTYLASVAVSDYYPYLTSYQGIEKNIPVEIYTNISDTGFIGSTFSNLKQILGIYENHFGPYRWERVGYVSVPFSGGAMEHATNITIGEGFITGDHSYENLIAHELSHHWFGDLITCHKAEEMWLNEGWAEFCEKFYTEILYGKNVYKSIIRENHRRSIQFDYVEDGGYRTLSDMPMQYTYGSTTYNKGADVVHTLRNYMGDNQFFSSVKSFLDSNAFSSISTAQLAAFLQRHTGQNITCFMDDWVNQPGYVHYSVDSFLLDSNMSEITATVYIRQRVMGGSAFHTCDSLELTFLNCQWQKYTAKVNVNGALTVSNIILPIAADQVLADMEEKMSDATSDCYKVIRTTGLTTFEETHFTLETTHASDSALVRVEHNWIAPDPYLEPADSILRISDYRYWKIEGIFPPGFSAKGRFLYNRSKPSVIYSNTQGWLDHDLLSNIRSADSLILLYRSNASEKWRLCNFTRTGSYTSGIVSTDNLRPGEYTFGIGKPNLSGINMLERNSSGLLISPNPTEGNSKISYAHDFTHIMVYDSSGRIVSKLIPIQGAKEVIWNPGNLKGVYMIRVIHNNRELTTGKLIIR